MSLTRTDSCDSHQERRKPRSWKLRGFLSRDDVLTGTCPKAYAVCTAIGALVQHPSDHRFARSPVAKSVRWADERGCVPIQGAPPYGKRGPKAAGAGDRGGSKPRQAGCKVRGSDPGTRTAPRHRMAGSIGTNPAFIGGTGLPMPLASQEIGIKDNTLRDYQV